ncbi:MAG TPA: GIY-YIG nuclease family protein [Candidatus Pacearchaeota archaeon]|nr:GIY-YIG nuclease family protein [Candidatus Pacearchaeota archaeon]
MMDILKEKLNNLPKNPGAYLLKGQNEAILYIGKAKNIKKRVLDHFKNKKFPDTIIIPRISDIDYIETENEKQALILELQLIKKYKPKYNVQWQDDKNYSLVNITGETIPRIFTGHQPQESLTQFGPFVSAKELKSFLAELRKILPYRTCKRLPRKPCLYFDLGVCLGYCIKPQLKKKYARIIRSLTVLLGLYKDAPLRIEAYDISNLSGSLGVGSMVVVTNGKPDKTQYKKFKIKTVQGQNDVACLREVLNRRMKHTEWTLPDLIILDGGKGQLKAAAKITIPVLAMSKIRRDQKKAKIFSPFAKNSISLDKLPQEIQRIFFTLRNEAHRFAISYNIKRREKKLFGKNHET